MANHRVPLTTPPAAHPAAPSSVSVKESQVQRHLSNRTSHKAALVDGRKYCPLRGREGAGPSQPQSTARAVLRTRRTTRSYQSTCVYGHAAKEVRYGTTIGEFVLTRSADESCGCLLQKMVAMGGARRCRGPRQRSPTGAGARGGDVAQDEKVRQLQRAEIVGGSSVMAGQTPRERRVKRLRTYGEADHFITSIATAEKESMVYIADRYMACSSREPT